MRLYGGLAPYAVGHFLANVPIGKSIVSGTLLTGASYPRICDMACQNLPTAVAPQPPASGCRSWEFRVPLASLWPATSRDDGHEIAGRDPRGGPASRAARRRSGRPSTAVRLHSRERARQPPRQTG